MSLAVTTIPIDIKSIISALPRKAHIHSVKLKADNSGVEVVWDSPEFVTPYTFPVEYPLSKLTLTEPMVANSEYGPIEPVKVIVNEKPVDKRTKAWKALNQ